MKDVRPSFIIKYFEKFIHERFGVKIRCSFDHNLKSRDYVLTIRYRDKSTVINICDTEELHSDKFIEEVRSFVRECTFKLAS
jgi:hypothetical protein